MWPIVVGILKSLTSVEYTKLKDSFTFTEKIVQQYSEFFMGKLDIHSYFSNTPLEETIGIFINTLFENTESVGL